jgi:hypothetical protein
VEGTNSGVFAVSYHLDTRPLYATTANTARLTIVAAVLGGTPSNLFCNVRFQNNSVLQQRVQPRRRSRQLLVSFPFRPVVLSCLITLEPHHHFEGLEAGLSAGTHQPTYKPVNIVPLLLNSGASKRLQNLPTVATTVEEYSQGKGSISVCTQPLRDDAYAATLTEWVEFHRNMGVDKVFLYLFNPGPYISQLIKYYVAQGTVEVLDWVMHKSILRDAHQRCILPFFVNTTGRVLYANESIPCSYHQDIYGIPWWGQELALQDCLYRTMGRYRWVAMVDIDEWITPRLPSLLTWPSLLAKQTGAHYHAAYSFQNAILCSECANQFVANGTALLPIDVAPARGALQPTAGFGHILWSGTRGAHNWGYKAHTKVSVCVCVCVCGLEHVVLIIGGTGHISKCVCVCVVWNSWCP